MYASGSSTRRGMGDDARGLSRAGGGGRGGANARDYFEGRHTYNVHRGEHNHEGLEYYLVRLDREDCLDILRKHGLSSLEALRSTTIDHLESIGIMKGHAIIILRAMDRDDILTSLHYAAANCDLKKVTYLLDRGQSPIARDENGNTPLMHAMANRSFRRAKDFVPVLIALVEAQVQDRNDDAQRRDREFMELLDAEDHPDARAVLEKHITAPYNSARRTFLKALGLFSDDDEQNYELHGVEDDHKFIPYKALTNIQLLNAGNFGVTFKAMYMCRGIPTPVVCKISRQRASDDEWNELRSLRNVPQHKNVCPLLGLCTDFKLNVAGAFDGVDKPALIIPFIEGKSLRQAVENKDFVKRGRLDVLKVAEVAESMASGLAHLHHHNIVHRDLALRNFMWRSREEYKTEKDEAVIIDFGLAMQMMWPVSFLFRGKQTMKISCYPRLHDFYEMVLGCFDVKINGKELKFNSAEDPKTRQTSVEDMFEKAKKATNPPVVEVLAKPGRGKENRVPNIRSAQNPDQPLPWKLLSPESAYAVNHGPAIDRQYKSTDASDVWMLGLAFIQMFRTNGERGVFSKFRNIKQLKAHFRDWVHDRVPLDLDFDIVPMPFKNLVEGMLHYNADKRPLAKDVYKTLTNIVEYLRALPKAKIDNQDFEIIALVRSPEEPEELEGLEDDPCDEIPQPNRVNEIYDD